MRFSFLLPMACAVVAFVLGMLCLFAGSKPNFMEEYHIITLNTSTLGNNLLSESSTSTSSSAAPTSTGFFGSLIHNATAELDNITNTLENDLNGELNSLADRLAAELGIDQWYSLHLMDMCEGNYSPNATAKNAKLNVTSCTNRTAMYHFDITSELNQQLELGPLKLNLSDIDWPSDIQSGLNDLSTAVNAVFVLYAIGIAAAGLAILAAPISFFLNGSRLVSFANLGLASLSLFALLVASIIVTVVQTTAANLINKYGNEIGVYAYKGAKYMALTWVSFAVMVLACAAWCVEFVIGRRNRQREYSEKPVKSGWRHRRSDEAALRRSGV